MGSPIRPPLVKRKNSPLAVLRSFAFPQNPPGLRISLFSLRGKKPKDGVWGKLRSWFPQDVIHGIIRDN